GGAVLREHRRRPRRRGQPQAGGGDVGAELRVSDTETRARITREVQAARYERVGRSCSPVGSGAVRGGEGLPRTAPNRCPAFQSRAPCCLSCASRATKLHHSPISSPNGAPPTSMRRAAASQLTASRSRALPR